MEVSAGTGKLWMLDHHQPAMSFEEIAVELEPRYGWKMTKQGVQQIHSRAIAKLRKRLACQPDVQAELEDHLQ